MIGLPEGRPAGFLALLSDRRFRSYWLSQAAGDAGYAVYAISVIWLGYRISGSAAVVGLLLGVEFGVYALSFVAGAVIDRVRRLRDVLLVGYTLQAVGAFTLGGLLATGRLTVPELLVLVALISLVWDFTWTANNALPPHLVGEGELLRANSLVSAVSGGNQLAGYAIGGVLLLAVGPAGAQFLYGALNLVAAALALPIAVVIEAPAGGSLLGRLREGWRFLARPDGATQRELAVFGSLEGVLSLAPPLLIALVSAESYGSSAAATYALLFVSFAIGGLAGSLTLGQWNPRRRLALALFGSTVLEGGLLLVGVLSAPDRPLGMLAWFGVGMCDVVLWTVLLAYVQARTPRPLLGRTITNVYLFRGSTRAAGVVALGTVGALVAAPVLGEYVGLGFFAVAAVGWVALPRLRELSY